MIAAYEQLQSEIDRLFGAVARADIPNPVRIVFTRCPHPYGGDQELITAVRTDRILEMTASVASAPRMHPLLGCEFGGGFDRFRAIHDLIGHVEPEFGFDLGGEVAAWLTQDRLHTRLARRALATEIVGVNSARWSTGEAPELKAMLFDRKFCPGRT